MGYHISIVRKSGRKIKPIAKEEWEQLVASSPDLSFEQTEDGIKAVAWKRNDEIKGWLDWCDGEIWTNTPENDLVQKMIEIAEKLNARVRGDEGEYYRSTDKTYYDPVEKEEREKDDEYTRKIIRETRRKNMLIRGIVFIIFMLLSFMVRSCGK